PTRRNKAITRALGYVETHAHRMQYVTLEALKLPIGSGQVESAVRRVVNLRFKAPGSFWTETTVSGLMHLRAAFKAGRWDEIMSGVIVATHKRNPAGPQTLLDAAHSGCKWAVCQTHIGCRWAHIRCKQLTNILA